VTINRDRASGRLDGRTRSTRMAQRVVAIGDG
jgi:hypothetical protein